MRRSGSSRISRLTMLIKVHTTHEDSKLKVDVERALAKLSRFPSRAQLRELSLTLVGGSEPTFLPDFFLMASVHDAGHIAHVTSLDITLKDRGSNRGGINQQLVSAIAMCFPQIKVLQLRTVTHSVNTRVVNYDDEGYDEEGFDRRGQDKGGLDRCEHDDGLQHSSFIYNLDSEEIGPDRIHRFVSDPAYIPFPGRMLLSLVIGCRHLVSLTLGGLCVIGGKKQMKDMLQPLSLMPSLEILSLASMISSLVGEAEDWEPSWLRPASSDSRKDPRSVTMDCPLSDDILTVAEVLDLLPSLPSLRRLEVVGNIGCDLDDYYHDVIPNVIPPLACWVPQLERLLNSSPGRVPMLEELIIKDVCLIENMNLKCKERCHVRHLRKPGDPGVKALMQALLKGGRIRRLELPHLAFSTQVQDEIRAALPEVDLIGRPWDADEFDYSGTDEEDDDGQQEV